MVKGGEKLPILFRSLLSSAGRWLINPWFIGVIACGALYAVGYFHGASVADKKHVAELQVIESEQQQKLIDAYKQRDKNAEESQQRLDQIASDSSDADDVIKRLQHQIAASNAAAKTGALASSQKFASTVDMYSVMLKESAERNKQLADYADRLREHLNQCNIEAESP